MNCRSGVCRQFEVLVCVADEQDPAVAVFERIQQRNPHVDARLFTGGRDGIINPLVHNLAPAYDAAKYDIIWISTSRIKGNNIISFNFISSAVQGCLLYTSPSPRV